MTARIGQPLHDHPCGDQTCGECWLQPSAHPASDATDTSDGGEENYGPGCDCKTLCTMGPTCPGGILAGLPHSGCARTGPTPEGEADRRWAQVAEADGWDDVSGRRLRAAAVEGIAWNLLDQTGDTADRGPSDTAISDAHLTAERILAPAPTPEGVVLGAEERERYAEALHFAMWGINSVPGMKSRLGVHQHTTDPAEYEAQREFMRRCIAYAETTTGLTPARLAAERAAHEGLRAAVEALADEWERRADVIQVADTAPRGLSLRVHAAELHAALAAGVRGE